MSDPAEQVARRLLEGIVPDHSLASYLQLTAHGACLREEAADLLGGAEQVDALLGAELAYLKPAGAGLPPCVVPAPPDLALQGTLAGLSRRLVAEQERVLDGQRRMAETPPSAGASADGHVDRLVRILTDRSEISETARGLLSAVRRDWLTLENHMVERPLDESAAMPPPPSLDDRVRCRTIYEAACTESPLGARLIEINARAGEEARFVPRIGMKAKIADEAIAMVPLTPTGASGALLIRSSVIVGALREYFELLWERAIPIGAAHAGTPLSPVQTVILNLLAQGISDESIARQVSMAVPTVRRHIGVIREHLGAETRFAAGAAAVRRGWVK
ncbi:hypothetical protein [Actinomadura xylanilytica]|uniref:hypothetical protein n=1 Tax=Actinomadura xylanilytica TaxID=887459 RepID=UPI00255B30DF|nr:hypothetical protein [Actinomadura xylanilytica]MDL4770693.1 hypothetical protein [Actinomadura xylanilytica]